MALNKGKNHSNWHQIVEFSDDSYTPVTKIVPLLAALWGILHYRDSARTGWSAVSILWLGESLIYTFCVCVSAYSYPSRSIPEIQFACCWDVYHPELQVFKGSCMQYGRKLVVFSSSSRTDALTSMSSFTCCWDVYHPELQVFKGSCRQYGRKLAVFSSSSRTDALTSMSSFTLCQFSVSHYGINAGPLY